MGRWWGAGITGVMALATALSPLTPMALSTKPHYMMMLDRHARGWARRPARPVAGADPRGAAKQAKLRAKQCSTGSIIAA
jgi:hypothetical protein